MDDPAISNGYPESEAQPSHFFTRVFMLHHSCLIINIKQLIIIIFFTRKYNYLQPCCDSQLANLKEPYTEGVKVFEKMI